MMKGEREERQGGKEERRKEGNKGDRVNWSNRIDLKGTMPSEICEAEKDREYDLTNMLTLKQPNF